MAADAPLISIDDVEAAGARIGEHLQPTPVAASPAPKTDGHSGLAVARVLETADRAMNAGTEVLLQPEPVVDITIDSIPAREMPAPVVLDQASA